MRNGRIPCMGLRPGVHRVNICGETARKAVKRSGCLAVWLFNILGFEMPNIYQYNMYMSNLISSHACHGTAHPLSSTAAVHPYHLWQWCTRKCRYLVSSSAGTCVPVQDVSKQSQPIHLSFCPPPLYRKYTHAS